MISFARLSHQGWLGNQLFQYAFLRTSARRLGVRFFCPAWQGDRIFALKDEDERAREPIGTVRSYVEPYANLGFNPDALTIADGTALSGYFQSERYYADIGEVRRWYTFRDEITARVRARYAHLDFSRGASLHLRFGNMKHLDYCYLPCIDYYRRALAEVKRNETIFVFSDEPEEARKVLRELDGNFFVVEGNEDVEDLYMISRCRDHISGLSTFGWWGVWLDPRPHKIVVVPREGSHRPGYGRTARNFWPDGWRQLPALRGFRDDYRIRLAQQKLRRKLTRPAR